MGVKFETLKMMFEMQKIRTMYIYVKFKNKNYFYLCFNLTFSPPSLP
jgi:hypothetical protein